jgi:hypothetical protein
LEVKKVVVEEIRLQKEIHNCQRSLLIKNVDKLVADIDEPVSRLSLVDQVTKILHNICDGAVSALDVYTLGQQSNTVCVMLGSKRQKSTCFHALLAYIRNNKPAKETW